MRADNRLAPLKGQMVAMLAVCNAIMGVVMSTTVALADTAAARGGPPIAIVALGDSLTAGFMLQPAEAFPVQLQAALKAKGHNVAITNAGVSGDTAAAGLARFDWAVTEGTEAVIVELGANDALRGIDPKRTRADLDQILKKLKDRNIDVLLTGMRGPTNWGEDYRTKFDAMYPELATSYGALLYPFFLDGVAMDPKQNFDDGLHPRANGVATIVQRILPKVEELIARVQARRAAKS